MTVTLDIPFLYNVTTVRRNRRKEECFLVLGRTRVDVAEIASDAAPVAATWTKRFVEPGKTRAHATTCLEYRSRGRGLMRELSEDLRKPGRGYHREVTPETAQNTFDRWHREVSVYGMGTDRYHGGFDYTLLPEPGTSHFRRALPERELEGGRIVESDRNETVRKLENAFAASAAFVDGVLFVPSAGPGYAVIDTAFMKRRVEIRVLAEFGWGSGVMDTAAVFRGDRLADAVEAAQRCLTAARAERRQMNFVEDVAPLTEQVRIIRPRDFAVDDDAVAVRTAVERLVSGLRPIVHDLPPAAMMAYAELRDGLAQAADGPLPEDLSRKAVALDGLMGDAASRISAWRGVSPVSVLVDRGIGTDQPEAARRVR